MSLRGIGVETGLRRMVAHLHPIGTGVDFRTIRVELDPRRGGAQSSSCCAAHLQAVPCCRPGARITLTRILSCHALGGLPSIWTITSFGWTPAGKAGEPAIARPPSAPWSFSLVETQLNSHTAGELSRRCRSASLNSRRVHESGCTGPLRVPSNPPPGSPHKASFVVVAVALGEQITAQLANRPLRELARWCPR